MAKLSYQRKQCQKFFVTNSGLVRCTGGCLKGKDYCAGHRPEKWERGESCEMPYNRQMDEIHY